MKKLLTAITLSITLTTGANALSANQYLGNQINTANANAAHARNESHTAKNVAIFAVGIAVISLFVAVNVSANNPGHVRLARF